MTSRDEVPMVECIRPYLLTGGKGFVENVDLPTQSGNELFCLISLTLNEVGLDTLERGWEQ